MQWTSTRRLAFLALLGGAAGIGFAPIFVRLSEVGPSATAFYRLFFALPLLWLAASLEGRPSGSPDGGAGADALAGVAEPARGGEPLKSPRWVLGLAGLLFAGDLAFWHWSIKLTSVANSTLLTNCAPLVVMLGARILFREKTTVVLLLGLGVASVGAAMLVGASLQLTVGHLFGDFLALVTALFYGGYLLTIKYLRASMSTARILSGSGLVSCAALLVIALISRESIWAISWRGWTVLVALALVSHVGGQGLIAYALAHLPAGFSSVGLLFQPVVAAFLAYVILSESLSLLQVAGAIVTVLGIVIATGTRAAPQP
jgi:drug/metabolite transporter (DMT)-like permease